MGKFQRNLKKLRMNFRKIVKGFWENYKENLNKFSVNFHGITVSG